MVGADEPEFMLAKQVDKIRVDEALVADFEGVADRSFAISLHPVATI